MFDDTNFNAAVEYIEGELCTKTLIHNKNREWFVKTTLLLYNIFGY